MKESLFLDVLMVLFAVHIIHTYLASFRREATHHKAFRYAAWSLYILFLYLIMFSNSRYPLLTLFGNLILMTVLLFACGCGDIKTALFRSCIYHTSRMVVEVATQSILLATLEGDPFVVGNLISTIAMYIIVQMYKRWKGRDLTTPLPFRYWIRLFLVPCSSIFITHHAHVTALHNGETAFFLHFIHLYHSEQLPDLRYLR